MKKKLMVYLLIFVLFTTFVSAIYLYAIGAVVEGTHLIKEYSTNKDDIAIMPRSICQMTCTDDDTGTKYGIAFEGIAWHNDKRGDEDNPEEDSKKNKCYLYLDAYYGEVREDGTFSEDALFWSRKLTDEKRYGHDADSDETYSLTFFEGLNLNELTGNFYYTALPYFGKEVLYPLLYESFIDIVKSDTKIEATYNHRINTCVIDTKIKIKAYCNKKKDYVYINCDLYQDGDKLKGDKEEEAHTYHVGCKDCDEKVTEGE